MKINDTGICEICGKEFTATYSRQRVHKECIKERELRKKERIEYSKFTIFQRDDFKCVYCGRSPIENGVMLVLDHIISYADTKDNSIYNLITCCYECNIAKGAWGLSKEVYERIIQRNIKKNKGISMKKQIELNDFFDKWFGYQKEKNVEWKDI